MGIGWRARGNSGDDNTSRPELGPPGRSSGYSSSLGIVGLKSEQQWTQQRLQLQWQ